MKNALLFIGVLIFSCPLWSHSNNSPSDSSSSQSGKIVISIEGLDNPQGQAMIALHNTKKTFLKKTEPFRRAIVPISGDSLTYTFDEIPHGEYSVAVIQDDNKNMDLDLGKMFIPKEKFGFSNNPSSKYGPPGYKKTTFELNTEVKEINIKLYKITL